MMGELRASNLALTSVVYLAVSMAALLDIEMVDKMVEMLVDLMAE